MSSKYIYLDPEATKQLRKLYVIPKPKDEEPEELGIDYFWVKKNVIDVILDDMFYSEEERLDQRYMDF